MCVFSVIFPTICISAWIIIMFFFSAQNHAFTIIINQHDCVNCIHYMVDYYFVLIHVTNLFIRRELCLVAQALIRIIYVNLSIYMFLYLCASVCGYGDIGDHPQCESDTSVYRPDLPQLLSSTTFHFLSDGRVPHLLPST